MRLSWMMSFAVSCLVTQACSSSPPQPAPFPTEDDPAASSEPTNTGDDGEGDSPSPVDGDPIAPVDCSVTWTKHILPRIQNVWRCGATQCHGGADGNFPKMDTTQSDATYTVFTTTNVDGQLLASTKSKNPDDSALACLLAGTCGQRMPYQGVSDSDLEVARAWLACGSPR